MSCYVVDQTNYREGHNVGGKARNLFHLQRHGLPVPEFVCVSGDAFKDCIAPVVGEIKQLLAECDFDNYEILSDVSTRLKRVVLSCELLPDVKRQLAGKVAGLSRWSSFSVRSSATNEDGTNNSFAGQLGTFLNVSQEQLEQKIKACWASAFEPGVLTYLKRANRDPVSNCVSVVIQRMVFAHSSGVIFQADPRGGVHRKVIAAGFGLGEGVVSDKVECDLYVWNKLNGEWQLEVNEKTRRIIRDKNGGVCEVALPEALRNQPVLDEAQRNALIDRSKSIAAVYPHYQDIEWSFDETGKLYILQSRPITTVPSGYERAFDNSNIAESYPGVILPMTFSILHRDYYHCVREALRTFGASESTLAKHDKDLQRLVSYVDGRAYYNINNWYRTLLLSPYFKIKIIRYFEEMIGTEGSFSNSLHGTSLTWFEKARLVIGFPLKFSINLFSHERLIKRYFKQANALEQEFREIDLTQQSSDELIGHLDSLSSRFMRLLSIPILNDFYTMIFMSLTREMFNAVGIPNAAELLNRLLANQKVESSKPVLSLQALAQQVRDTGGLYKALSVLLDKPELNSVAEVSAYLVRGGFGAFDAKFQVHVDRYGHRSPKELIMEASTFREDPFQLIRIILQSSQLEEITRVSSDNPENELLSHLEKNKWKKPLLWLLHKTRRTVAHREATRLDRGLHFSFYRTIIRRLGQRMVADGLLKCEQDVFLLTVDELDDYREGCSIDGDLMGLVAYRKTQLADWQTKDPEERLFTSGAVYGNRIPSKRSVVTQSVDSLAGTGCSEGMVTGEAAVVSDPSATHSVKGKVLVSETTDPGWVFLMTLSAGLISERGSLLSHTAIIGRELGIPTIVGVKNATKIINDGDSVSMDGTSGQVTIHSSNLTK